MRVIVTPGRSIPEGPEVLHWPAVPEMVNVVPVAVGVAVAVAVAVVVAVAVAVAVAVGVGDGVGVGAGKQSRIEMLSIRQPSSETLLSLPIRHCS